jgi:hypothetical protein
VAEATLELARACLEALRADATLASFVGDRIFDRVPEKQDGTPNVPSPYISLGPTTAAEDAAECIDGLEVALQFDAWSWGEGEAYASAEVREISGRVRKVLNRRELALSENALVNLEHRFTQILRETDGITNHGVVQFLGLIETP